MNEFERVYQIDPEREAAQAREKHSSLELSDLEHLEKLGFLRTGHYVKFNPEPAMFNEGIVELIVEAAPIPMNLEMPILEETIKKGNKVAKSKTKTIEKKAAKVSAKSNKPAVARIQKKL